MSQLYYESVWIELIVAETENLKLKTENWKHYSKIILKCVNSIVGPIFLYFLMREQYVNSEPMWGYCSCAEKKKDKTWKWKRKFKHNANTHYVSYYNWLFITFKWTYYFFLHHLKSTISIWTVVIQIVVFYVFLHFCDGDLTINQKKKKTNNKNWTVV